MIINEHNKNVRIKSFNILTFKQHHGRALLTMDSTRLIYTDESFDEFMAILHREQTKFTFMEVETLTGKTFINTSRISLISTIPHTSDIGNTSRVLIGEITIHTVTTNKEIFAMIRKDFMSTINPPSRQPQAREKVS